MLKTLKAFFLAVLVGIVVFPGYIHAMEVLSSNQLEAGMRGYAKTVIEGDRIDSFSVEIIGVMDDGNDSEGKIIARVSGDVIEKTGGVLQGMSGSPVYIDGKLIGAISGGWKDVDNKTCLITPINDMLKSWNMPDEKNKSRIKQIDLKAIAKEKEAKEKELEKKAISTRQDKMKPEEKSAAKQEAQIEAEKKNNDKQEGIAAENGGETKHAEPLATPLMVSGFGEAGMHLLKEQLQPLQLVPYMTGNAGNQAKPVNLEPGSSIGVQLVRGDITMAAIGTVTAVENGKVLAFGHPFLRKGNVNYFMTDAQIITTASGAASGFKVGVPGNLVGRINQDRSAAIGGIIGEYPSVVPLRVTVEDAQLKNKKSYGMQVAYDEELLPTLIPTMVYNAMDKARDRLGYGTAQVSFEIMTNSAVNGKFKRDNMFYNVQDVGQVAVAELLQTLSLLSANNAEETDIVSVKVDVKLDETKKTASLVEVVPDKASVKAGQIVNLKIKIKPYRKNEEVFIVPYQVPKNQPAGLLNLEIRGGGLVPLLQVLLQQQGVDLAQQEDKLKPLNVKLEELSNSNRNNEIIISPAPTMPEEIMGLKNVKPKKSAKETEKPAVKNDEKKSMNNSSHNAVVKHKTDYIIDNVLQIPIRVEVK